MPLFPFLKGMPMAVNPIIYNLPLVIQKERYSRNLSQQELALRSGIARAHLGRIERGDTVPGLDVIYRLEKALMLPAGSLIQKASAGTVEVGHARATDDQTNVYERDLIRRAASLLSDLLHYNENAP